MRASRPLTSTLLLAASLAFACGDGEALPPPDAGAPPTDGGVPQDAGPTDGGVQVAQIIVMPDPDILCNFGCSSITEGGSVRLVAVVLGPDEEELALPVTWTSAEEAVATVDDDGVVTGVAIGEVAIRASAGGASGEMIITVNPRQVFSIILEPDALSFEAAGETQALTATAYGELGEVLEVELLWDAANPQVATIDGSGVVTAVAPGTSVVFVYSLLGGFASARVTVGDGAAAGAGFALEGLVASTTHTCGLTGLGAAWCWGWNFFGQLGNDERGAQDERFPSPLAVAGEHVFATLAAGGNHTCALTAAGVPWCWGLNEHGQVGIEDLQVGGPVRPFLVEGGLTFEALTAGGAHTCGLTGAGAAWCWGSGYDGQLGTGNRLDRRNPTAVPGDHVFTTLSAGYAHTCGLTADGEALCWGSASFGEIGTGLWGDGQLALSPAEVSGGHRFVALDAASSHSCAVTAEGEVWCWGRGEFGQLGDAGFVDRPEPVQVETELSFRAVTVGSHHTCALTEAGEAWCWGTNGDGQLGTGLLEDSASPARVAGSLRFRSLEAGGNSTCGVTLEGQGYCWGSAFFGELGAGFGGEGRLSVVPWPIETPAP